MTVKGKELRYRRERDIEELTKILRTPFYKRASNNEKKRLIETSIDHFKNETRQRLFPKKRQIARLAAGIRKSEHVDVEESFELAKKRLGAK